MNRSAIVAALAIALASPRADARCGAHCPRWLDGVAYTFAAGLVGGYAYGTGAFIHHDLTEPDQSLEYGVGEATFNGLFAFAWGAGTLDAIGRGDAGAAVALGGLTALHGTLAGHGVWRVYQERREIRAPMVSIAWLAGSAYGLNTLAWSAGLAERHGRRYGVAELAVNAPIALGLGYLAFDRFAHDRAGPGLLYGGMAAVSGALAIHGLNTAIAPRPKFDLLGTDVIPTVVGDGVELAPGLGAAGTW